MTTNKPGSVNQNPLFGCMSCFLDHSWPAEDLRVYGGECWCDLCWGELRWDFDDLPYWDELPRFIPPYVAELEALQAECEELRKDAGLIERLANLLPEIDDALEDLELHGTHSDKGYVKLAAWYSRMARTVNAIDAAMQGGGE